MVGVQSRGEIRLKFMGIWRQAGDEEKKKRRGGGEGEGMEEG